MDSVTKDFIKRIEGFDQVGVANPIVIREGLPVQYFGLERAASSRVSAEDKTVEIVFSTDAAIETFFGFLILDHSEGSVRLDRAKSGHFPALFNHDKNKHLGIVENAEIVDGKEGHGMVRFGQSELAQEKFRDVVDKVLNGVSVGARLHRVILQERVSGGLDIFRAVDWEPLESSFTPTPADIGSGVLRMIGDGSQVPGKVEIFKKEHFVMKNKGTNQEGAGVGGPLEPGQVMRTNPDGTQIGGGFVENQYVGLGTDAAAKEGADLERARIVEITAIAEKFKLQKEGAEAIGKGRSVDQFRAIALKSLETEGAVDTGEACIDVPPKEMRKYSISNILRANIFENRELAAFELEISSEISKKIGQTPQGMWIPHEAVIGQAEDYGILGREIPGLKSTKREILTTGDGAGLVGTKHTPENFIELLRNNTVYAGLGVRILTGLVESLSLPRQDGAASGAWENPESSAVTPSDSVYANLVLAPKIYKASTEYSNKTLKQSLPVVERLVIEDLMAVIGIGIDRAAWHGDGLLGSPLGIIEQVGIGSVTGTTLGWPAVVEFEVDVAEANALTGPAAYVCRPSVMGLMKGREAFTSTGKTL